MAVRSRNPVGRSRRQARTGARAHCRFDAGSACCLVTRGPTKRASLPPATCRRRTRPASDRPPPRPTPTESACAAASPAARLQYRSGSYLAGLSPLRSGTSHRRWAKATGHDDQAARGLPRPLWAAGLVIPGRMRGGKSNVRVQGASRHDPEARGHGPEVPGATRAHLPSPLPRGGARRPRRRHWDIDGDLLRRGGAAGRLVPLLQGIHDSGVPGASAARRRDGSCGRRGRRWWIPRLDQLRRGPERGLAALGGSTGLPHLQHVCPGPRLGQDPDVPGAELRALRSRVVRASRPEESTRGGDPFGAPVALRLPTPPISLPEAWAFEALVAPRGPAYRPGKPCPPHGADR